MAFVLYQCAATLTFWGIRRKKKNVIQFLVKPGFHNLFKKQLFDKLNVYVNELEKSLRHLILRNSQVNIDLFSNNHYVLSVSLYEYTYLIQLVVG